jgi:hypothetical protein
MRKAYTAEWLLALVMPADNAAATTGDLLELSSSQSSRGFWTSVLRVFGASLVRSIVQRPAAVFGTAFSAFLLQFVLPLPVLFFFPRYFIFTHVELWVVSALAITALTQFVIGRSLSAFSRANPGAVCLAIGLLNAIVGACNVNMVSVNLAVWQLPLIVGVLMSHRSSRLAVASR